MLESESALDVDDTDSELMTDAFSIFRLDVLGCLLLVR